MAPKDRLFVALDVSDLNAANELVVALRDPVGAAQRITEEIAAAMAERG